MVQGGGSRRSHGEGATPGADLSGALRSAAGVALASLDAAGRVLYVNPGFLSLWGFADAGEVLGRDFGEFWAPDDAAQRARERLVAEGSWDGELIARRATGEEFVARVSVGVIPDEHGPRSRTIVSCVDMTELRGVTEALRTSEAKYAAAFHGSRDAMIITRIADGSIREINETFERVTGISRADALASTTVELGLWPEPADRERVVAGLAAEGAVRDLEFAFRLGEGRALPGLYSAHLIDIDGQPHVLSVIRDISAEKAAEAAVRES